MYIIAFAARRSEGKPRQTVYAPPFERIRMDADISKHEIAWRAARLVPDLFGLAEGSALTAIRKVQRYGWLRQAPASKELLRVTLEFLGFGFFLVDFGVFRRMGPEVRDEFMDDLTLFALHRITDGMDDKVADEQKRQFIDLVNVNMSLYANYVRVLAEPRERPDGTALWWFSVYLLQTIEGHALNEGHRGKVYDVALAFAKSLDTSLIRTLTMPLADPNRSANH